MWMVCEGQPNQAALAPPSRSGAAARQGTAAHEVLEMCFPSFNNEPSDYLGEEMTNKYVIKQEDVNALEDAMEILLTVGRDIPTAYQTFAESKHDLQAIHKSIGGTMDIKIIANNRSVLKVIDYKHGVRVVEVKNNRQLLIYALIAINEYCIKNNCGHLVAQYGWGSVFQKVEVAILQPRADHDDGIYRTWVVSAKELDTFAAALHEAANKTDKEDAPLLAGDHCGWCPAKHQCPKFLEKTNELTMGAFDPIVDPKDAVLPNVKTVPLADLLKLKNFEPLIKGYFADLNDHLLGLIKLGIDVPGYKEVKTKSNRKWVDESKLVDIVSMFVDEEELYAERKLRTPAQLEKVEGVGKELVAQHTFKPDTGTSLAPDTDKRPAVTATAGDTFEAIETKGK